MQQREPGLSRKEEQELYLKIAYGKICAKTTKDNPLAVERKDKDGQVHYYLEYDSLTGTLERIRFKDGHEYGKQWAFVVRAGSRLYAVQMREDSRACIDFLKKVPLLKRGETYTFSPYDFTDKKGKRAAGLTIKDAGFNKVPSYYQEYITHVDGKVSVKNIHGYPEFSGNPKDKEDWKIYYIQVVKFLRERALSYLATEFSKPRDAGEPRGAGSEPTQEEEPLDGALIEVDLPF